MATGLSIKLTGQIGGQLVTAELGSRGIIATPFSGNVPDLDKLAHANGVTGLSVYGNETSPVVARHMKLVESSRQQRHIRD